MPTIKISARKAGNIFSYFQDNGPGWIKIIYNIFCLFYIQGIWKWSRLVYCKTTGG